MSEPLDDGDMPTDPGPFSKELLELFFALRNTDDPCERMGLMMELAERFAMEHDHTDHEANDNFHLYIEEYETTRLAFEQRAMRLARMSLDFMTHVITREHTEKPDPHAN